MSGETLLVLIGVGVLVGWLAGQMAFGSRLSLTTELIIGVAGALIGGLLLPQLGLHLGSGIVMTIIDGALGALVLLALIRAFGGAGGWRARWGNVFGRRW